MQKLAAASHRLPPRRASRSSASRATCAAVVVSAQRQLKKRSQCHLRARTRAWAALWHRTAPPPRAVPSRVACSWPLGCSSAPHRFSLTCHEIMARIWCEMRLSMTTIGTSRGPAQRGATSGAEAMLLHLLPRCPRCRAR